MEIALAADLNYFCGMTVSACSIAMSASKAVRLRFHLLHLGFAETHRRQIEEAIALRHPDSEVVFIDMRHADLSRFPLYAESRMAYARLFLPELLRECRYVIYSDVDILWMSDVARLWQMRNQVDLVSCAHELSWKTIEQERRWFTGNGLPFDPEKYFCTGVSFYNLDAIRGQDAFRPVMDFGLKYNGFNCADQSMMYGALGTRVSLLPDEWMSFPRNGIRVPPGSPLVLHYAGEVPWKVTRVTHMVTDVQLLWFKLCADVFGESVWRSLRRFYTSGQIVMGRAVFLSIYRLPPIRWLFAALMHRMGRGTFDEALPRCWRCWYFTAK